MPAVKSDVDAFGHAATQAPQPMQAAPYIAWSTRDLTDQYVVRIGRAASVHVDIAAGLHDAVERAAVDHQVLDDREGVGAPRLDQDLGAVFEAAPVELAGRGGFLRAVRDAVDHHAARAADALAAIVVEGDPALARGGETLVDAVEHLEQRHVGRDVDRLVGLEAALRLACSLPPDAQPELCYL